MKGIICTKMNVILTVPLNFWTPKKYQWPLLRNKFTSLKLISAGSHCLDIVPATADDPKWLTAQRNKTVKVIKWWFHKYYNDLRGFA